MKYQKKSFSIQGYKIQMDVCLFVCVLVQRTPPRRSILAIYHISMCRYGPNLSPLTQKKFFWYDRAEYEGK